MIIDNGSMNPAAAAPSLTAVATSGGRVGEHRVIFCFVITLFCSLQLDVSLIHKLIALYIAGLRAIIKHPKACALYIY